MQKAAHRIKGMPPAEAGSELGGGAYAALKHLAHLIPPLGLGRRYAIDHALEICAYAWWWIAVKCYLLERDFEGDFQLPLSVGFAP